MKLYTSPYKMELLIVIYQGEGNKNPPQANRQISENENDLDNFICLEPDMVYEGDIAFAVTTSKAVHFRAWNDSEKYYLCN